MVLIILGGGKWCVINKIPLIKGAYLAFLNNKNKNYLYLMDVVAGLCARGLCVKPTLTYVSGACNDHLASLCNRFGAV